MIAIARGREPAAIRHQQHRRIGLPSRQRAEPWTQRSAHQREADVHRQRQQCQRSDGRRREMIRPGLHGDELRQPAIDESHHHFDLGQREMLLRAERAEGHAECQSPRQHRPDRNDAGDDGGARPIGRRLDEFRCSHDKARMASPSVSSEVDTGSRDETRQIMRAGSDAFASSDAGS